MKLTAYLLFAFSLVMVSCERHDIAETKHLYEEHSVHGDDHGSHDKGHKEEKHSGEHGEKSHDEKAH